VKALVVALVLPLLANQGRAQDLPPKFEFTLGHKDKGSWRDVTITRDGKVTIVQHRGDSTKTFTGELTSDETKSLASALARAQSKDSASDPALELPTTNPVMAKILAVAKDAPAQDQQGLAKFTKAMQQAADQVTVFGWILGENGESKHLVDLIDGAHTIVPDEGALYERARKLTSAEERVSSHASLGPQFEIPGATTGPILFGKTTDGTGTWFQLEGYRAQVTISGLPDLVAHMWDYFKYKLTGKNQSRFGSSKETDKEPLVLSPDSTYAPSQELVPLLRGVANRVSDAPAAGGLLANARAGLARAFGRFSTPSQTTGMSELLSDRIGAATSEDPALDK